jgi:hypothetical protein
MCVNWPQTPEIGAICNALCVPLWVSYDPRQLERDVILSAMLAASLMLADATPAAAAATTTAGVTAKAAATPAKPAEDKLICRSESVTGSLMPKKVCRRASDMARDRQDQRENLERIQREVGAVTH